METSLTESVHAGHTVNEESVGDVTARSILFMPQRIDQNGAVDDDPHSEWFIEYVTAGLTEEGTITLVSMNPDGTVDKELTPSYSVGPSSGLSVPVKKYAGAKRDVGYTTTGGGDCAISVRAHIVRHDYSKSAMAEDPTAG